MMASEAQHFEIATPEQAVALRDAMKDKCDG